MPLDSGLLTEATGRPSGSGSTSRSGRRRASGRRTGCARPSRSDAVEQARLHVTALGLYEVFLNGERVGDVELAPGLHAVRASASSTSPTTSRRCCAPAATSSPCCWPTAGSAARSACRERPTSSAPSWPLRLQLEAPAARGVDAAAGHGRRRGARRPRTSLRRRPDRRPARGPPAGRPGAAPGGVRRQRLGAREPREVDVAVVRADRPAGTPGRGDPAAVGDAGAPTAPRSSDLGQNINGWLRARRPRAGRHPAHAPARRTPRRRRRPDHRRTSTSTCRSCPSRCRSGRSTRSSRPGSRATSSSRGSPRTASATSASRDTPGRCGRRRHGRRRALRPAAYRLVRVQRRAAQPPARGGRLVAARQRLRDPDRLPAARAGRVDRRLAGVRADGGVSSTTCSASAGRGCATSRSTSARTAASPTCRRCPPAEGFDGPLGRPQRLGRLG